MAQEPPAWFSDSLLELREDVAEAAKHGKRVMLYFGQDGCPYCRRLMEVNFRQAAIAAKAQKNLVALALNIWGDRQVIWVDGVATTEKRLAAQLKVQYTPTLLFFDEKGEVALRLNGYQPPERFKVALDYARLPQEGRPAYTDYLARRAGGEAAKEGDVAAEARGRPALVIVGRAGCRECDELEREGLKRPEVAQLLRGFAVVRRDLSGAWARANRITYTPSLVYLDAQGKEAFRTEGYLRPFHLAASVDYVASGAYRSEPSFQRYLQARADRMRAEGKAVDLWK